MTPLFVNDVEVGATGQPLLQCNLTFAPVSQHPGYIVVLIAPRELAGRVNQKHSVKSAAKSAIGMAEMLAHEIKNPLTPMRLTVQSFQKNSSVDFINDKNKINDFCETLIEQIDTMSNVATSFSDFATLPKTQLEKTDVVEATKKDC